MSNGLLYKFDKAVTKMNKLKEMRLAANMKQSDLGALMNCSPQSISNYELGLRDLDSSSICKLCEIFGCTADYLLGRSSLPTAELSEEESRLLQAYRRGDDRAKDMVKLALEPFVQEAGSSETA